MSKRKYENEYDDDDDDDEEDEDEIANVVIYSEEQKPHSFKHSLDSDEEDDEVAYEKSNILTEKEIKGAINRPLAPEAKEGFTAFNMKEEFQEGHFSKAGHFVFKKEKEVRDNWLDDIDWVKIKPRSDAETKDESEKGLADSDSDDDDDNGLGKNILFDPSKLYKDILDFLQPGETVSKALCRLGKGKKRISSAERWKRKKAGLSEIDENSDKIIKLTEHANELLTRTGNMDIYQESYESIKQKVDQVNKKDAELDMYADDFDTKEKGKLDVPSTSNQTDNDDKKEPLEQPTSWELKWSQNDDAEINGPHTTEQMFAWANEGYFKDKGWVRRTGQNGQFYTASRVDFEIYM